MAPHHALPYCTSMQDYYITRVNLMHVWISTLALMRRGLYLQVEAAAADVLQCSDAWRKGSASAKPASSILRLLAALDDLPAAVALNEAYALEGMLHSSVPPCCAHCFTQRYIHCCTLCFTQRCTHCGTLCFTQRCIHSRTLCCTRGCTHCCCSNQGRSN